MTWEMDQKIMQKRYYQQGEKSGEMILWKKWQRENKKEDVQTTHRDVLFYYQLNYGGFSCPRRLPDKPDTIFETIQ